MGWMSPGGWVTCRTSTLADGPQHDVLQLSPKHVLDGYHSTRVVPVPREEMPQNIFLYIAN